jgi:hypothetical protein
MGNDPKGSAPLRWRLSIGRILAALLCNASASVAASCIGDCGDDGRVTVSDLVTSVNVALGSAQLSVCPNADANNDGKVTVSDLVTAVNNALNGCPSTPTPTPTPTAMPPPGTPTPTSNASTSVPTTAPELFAWLQAGGYRDWPAESQQHPSPVHGTVRVFVNPTLFMSLEDQRPAHPAGAAAVKEFYSIGRLAGWSVMVKFQNDSAGGQGWYWYEGFGPSPGFSGNGLPICTGCHSSGQDFFRSTFPLQ